LVQSAIPNPRSRSVGKIARWAYRADESGRLGAEQISRTFDRNAVGADDYFSIDPHAVFEGEADYIPYSSSRSTRAMVERQSCRGDNAFQNAMPDHPMDIDIGPP